MSGEGDKVTACPKPEPRKKKSKPLRKPYVRPEKTMHYFENSLIMKRLNERTDSILSCSKQKQLGRQILTVEDYKTTASSEKELQEQCENYLKENFIYYIHIPDAAYKNKRSGHKLLGVPDLMIIKPNDKDKFNKCLLIELKSNSGKIRTGQKRVARAVNVYEIRSFIALKDLVGEFFK